MIAFSPTSSPHSRKGSYGEAGLTFVDRFGVHLSRLAVLRALGERTVLDLLDLGCGYRADLLHALEPRLKSGLGVDLKVSAEARKAGRLSFLEGTIESVLPDFSDHSFDVVMMLSVLEHLSDPLCILNHVRRITKPAGMLLINVPTWLGKPFLEFSAFRLGTSPVEEIDDHKMYYAKRDLWPLLIQAGFRPRNIRMKYHKFGLNLFATVQI